jgi:hypothetical protein
MQAILDNFWLMGILMAVLVLGVFLLRRPAHRAPATAAH